MLLDRDFRAVDARTLARSASETHHKYESRSRVNARVREIWLELRYGMVGRLN